eukprot:985014-Amphidinium_carterae.1
MRNEYSNLQGGAKDKICQFVQEAAEARTFKTANMRSLCLKQHCQNHLLRSIVIASSCCPQHYCPRAHVEVMMNITKLNLNKHSPRVEENPKSSTL